jgi:hypothetical protein
MAVQYTEYAYGSAVCRARVQAPRVETRLLHPALRSARGARQLPSNACTGSTFMRRLRLMCSMLCCSIGVLHSSLQILPAHANHCC